MDDQMRPELDNVLQCLSLNGYSVFSLIDDILAHGRNREDQRIKFLREGVERDAADICARLLSYDSTSASVCVWALGVAKSMRRSEVEEMTRKEHDLHFMTGHPLSLPNDNVVSPGLFFGTESTPTNGTEKVLNIGRTQFENPSHRHDVTINVLPDNVFLEIFSFCLSDPTRYPLQRTREWQRLVHVCQSWRRIIFASPRRLDLHLSCTYGTPVRQNLIYWPLFFPLIVDYSGSLRHHPVYGFNLAPDDEDNILAALQHVDRIHRVKISTTYSTLRIVATVMQESFPALTHLELIWDHKCLPALYPVLPGWFLGGSAPRLRHLHLGGISFPELPTLLLSARNLVTLQLEDIFQNDYISPEAMVAGLAALTRLRTLSIEFFEETSSPDQRIRRPDPPMRAILPALTLFHFKGYYEYLEDLLALIDTPIVDNVRIEYFLEEIQVPQLSLFIGRTANLKLAQFGRARVTFYCQAVVIGLDCPQGEYPQANLSLSFLGPWLDMQVPCMVHLLGQLDTMFSDVGHLSAHGDNVDLSWRGGRDSIEWLPFFRLLPAVEELHLSGGVAAYIASALEDTPEEMVTEVFPALHLLWLDEDNMEDCDEAMGSIEQFLSSRQLSGRPVTLVNFEGLTAHRRH